MKCRTRRESRLGLMRYRIPARALEALTIPYSHPVWRPGRHFAGRVTISLLGLMLLVMAHTAASAGAWLGWRGDACEGRSVDAHGPLHWSRTEGVRWKCLLPGEGHSSPIVTADAV